MGSERNNPLTGLIDCAFHASWIMQILKWLEIAPCATMSWWQICRWLVWALIVAILLAVIWAAITDD